MHIKVIGQGPDLVMIHGWSMHSAVWHTFAESLSQHFTLYLVDLPGHGQSDWNEHDFDLARLTQQLAEQLPDKAYWLGWSLGGLVSIAFAHRFPDRVNTLILLAATPCFVTKPDWKNAMEPSIFKAFADNLNDNQQETLQRFLMLQARGSSNSRDTIRQLSAQLAQQTPAKPEALSAGLKVLIEQDLRQELTELSCPIFMLLGERDTLIPVTLAEQVIRLNPMIRVSIIEKAGHAPFISDSQECQQQIEHFIHGN
jgi:pimeloyl-[acyl-carrier protein] methyl ester esterase